MRRVRDKETHILSSINPFNTCGEKLTVTLPERTSTGHGVQETARNLKAYDGLPIAKINDTFFSLKVDGRWRSIPVVHLNPLVDWHERISKDVYQRNIEPEWLSARFVTRAIDGAGERNSESIKG